MLKFFLVYCSIVPDGLSIIFSCCPISLPKSVFLLRRALSFLLRYTSLKMTPPFGTFFKTCVCGSASPQIRSLLQQIGRLLQQIRRLLQMMRKASSDDAEGFFRCCRRLLLMLRKASSEEAFRRCGQLLNSASSEEVVWLARTYIRHSSYVRV